MGWLLSTTSYGMKSKGGDLADVSERIRYMEGGQTIGSGVKFRIDEFAVERVDEII